MAESSPKGKKTLWEKEKLIVTSNFPLSRSVFKILVLQTHKNQGLFRKGLRNSNFKKVSDYGARYLSLTHSHTITLSDGSGKEAF